MRWLSDVFDERRHRQRCPTFQTELSEDRLGSPESPSPRLGNRLPWLLLRFGRQGSRQSAGSSTWSGTAREGSGGSNSRGAPSLETWSSFSSPMLLFGHRKLAKNVKGKLRRSSNRSGAPVMVEWKGRVLSSGLRLGC